MNINESVKNAPAGTILADVRTPEEYALGHVPGSVNWPLERLTVLDIPGDSPILTYCHSGSRSARAAAWLQGQCYDAENIGGILDWTGELEK